MPAENQLEDLSDVIDELATGTYSVLRLGPTTFTAGRRDASISTTLIVTAVVHPVSGRTLDRLPEGLRTHEAIAVITQTELKTAGPNQEPDVVTVAGADYQVQAVDRWQPSGNFFRAIATKVSSR